ncbi:type VI secretion system Vgr family protein [Methylobacterium longum]|uniref:Type VI secretion system tip protein TssI/VgrG n=1 Tax=Methylobacterium longum TaxID=767694 RepID=A0ABT8AUC1_9HYPH|nr:type VI secretion system tip protein TssI/VgrG [Methylobacterium longum]MDN3573345.1 type VI secretion system tip protein TssI/VgrG [Methylobacterium longum]GJE13942.1 Actin cross-linking toxin VgrG1 [Methylobacterium longum]
MQSSPKQEKRIARLKTPNSGDELVLLKMDGSEGLSELFEYRVDALSPNKNIDFTNSIGRLCTIEVGSYGGATRYFNGVLVEAQWTGMSQSLYAYHLVLRPWLWLLSRRSNCRIFNRKTVVAILREVLDEGGLGRYDIKANESEYPEIEYCVQYRESDLDFVSRLMEEFGLYTFYAHSDGQHLLVVADSKSCHQKVDLPAGKLPYVELAGQNRRISEHVYQWTAERRFRTGKFTLNDFDYMKPTADLNSESQGSESYKDAKLEAYDYPGRFTERDRGKTLSRIRLEAEQALDYRKHAQGDAISLYPGALVALDKHPTDDGEYLVVRAVHSIVSEAYATGAGSEVDEIYRGHYELLKSSRPFRAPLATLKPMIRGPQTAIVVTRESAKGEEIDVDEEGRIFVQFHWNRDKKRISRPVRVAQMWSGKAWGWQFIPRVGHEVVVEFLEGDPDQPIVVGAVYNKEYKYPYSLPQNKTMSGVKSDSSKGHNGYNEFVFEDKKNEEKVRFRAEKDHDSVVRHAETRIIGETFETAAGSPSRATTLKNGDESLKIESGNWNGEVAEKIHFKAGSEIVLEVGASKITMTVSTLKIESGQIKIEAVSEIEQTAPLIKIN